jgi:acyl-CoA synthetase (AMP-forming)/AMP-acid ligase II
MDAFDCPRVSCIDLETKLDQQHHIPCTCDIADNASQVYGLTETYGPITKGYHMQAWSQLPGDEKYAKMARQGHGFLTSMPARVIKTDVPADHIEDVEKNGKEIGEIVFYGNICAKGYYKDEEATRKLFAGGVLHTGDLAVMHEDGAIQILDRAKDIIISGMHDQKMSAVCILLIHVTRWREHL